MMSLLRHNTQNYNSYRKLFGEIVHYNDIVYYLTYDGQR